MKHFVIFTTFLLFNISLFAQANLPDSLAYTIFLVGDAGEINPDQKKVLKLLEEQLADASEQSAVVFLGDNLYPKGMPPSYSIERESSEAIINSQLNLVKDYPGKYFFIPGNHDWAQGRSFGWSYLENQEAYVEDAIDDDGNIFLPDNGCPGPVEVPLGENIILIIIDTQWFLHGWSKPDNLRGNCPTANPIEVLQSLEEIILRNGNKHILVATHHPMFTYGNHGGFNTFRDHIFPLTELVPSLYIPLPVIGSFYPLFRKLFGNIQDISHPTYQNMRNSFVNIFEKYPQTIHVSGHEHGLQYSFKDTIHYVVSGSAAKTEYVRTKGFAKYTEAVHGFAKLSFYKGGEIILEFFRLKAGEPEDKPSFRRLLMKKPLQPQLSAQQFETTFHLEDSTIVTYASDQYGRKGKLGKMLLGENYRQEWLQKLRFPVFDIGSEHGGLRIIESGGGVQTKSLRLRAANGKEYVLRSVEKYAENAVPEFLRETFAVDLVQDQISASHPYGALVVPYLAEGAGIYHTNPEVVFIPDDPRLGIYRRRFAKTLALYEERPDENWSNAPYFGNSKNIIGTAKLLTELSDDNDNEVDQKFTLRSRLFDVIIGDWDRHDDQWRWAAVEKENEKGNIYKPIPRDRDQVFFVNQGLLPSLVSRKWALPKLEGFDHEVRWTPGFMFNGRYFDRSFLTALSKEDWVTTARKIKDDLTDAEIEYAVRQWPDSIYMLHGAEIIAKLKSRRDEIETYAKEYYLFLAREVNVVGSNKHEYFLVNRLENGDVHVLVYKMTKDGEIKKPIYDRTFKFKETEEVRLYGLGGNDKFIVKGESNRSVKIRVIGGDDEDEMQDRSHVEGLARKTVFYDTKFENKFNMNRETKDETSTSPVVNRYDRQAFQYNLLMPLLTGNINPDEGLYVGAGFMYKTHGFRKDPFKQKHMLLGSYAFETASYNFKYNGVFTGILKDWDFIADLDVKQPDYVNNFFGMGNESEFNKKIDGAINIDDPIDYYRLQFSSISSSLGFSKKIGGFSSFSINHDYEAVQIEPEADPRFVNDFDDTTGSVHFDRYKHYMGATLDLTFDKRSDPNLTLAGVYWSNTLSFLGGIHNADHSFSSFTSTLAFYYTMNTLTLAARLGGGFNFGGNYEFYQAQIIDGKTMLRGYRKTRFYGDSKFYNNLEARLKLFTFRTYIFPGSGGVLFFNDVGRVWLEGENSDKWHHGYGGGIWFAPFNRTVVSTEIGISQEEKLFYVRLGFIF